MRNDGPFDLGALASSIDETRSRAGLSWAELSRRVGVSASTIRRYGEAADAEADGVLALIRWLDVAPEEFVPDSVVVGERLGLTGSGMIRADLRSLAALSPAHGGRSRATIQELVSVAQRAGRTVASLTRLADG